MLTIIAVIALALWFLLTGSAVLPNATGLTPTDLDAYAGALSRVPDVPWVLSPGGTSVNGGRSGPPSAPTAIKDDNA